MVVGPIEEEKLPQVKRNPWADNFFRPLLLTIMIMCFNISLVNFVRLINPNWRGAYFLFGMLLVTVEAIYSFRLFRIYHMRDISIWRYRLAEWVVLLVFLKIISYANKPMAFIVADLKAMWWNPINVISSEFYVMVFLAVASWVAATLTIADFEALYDPFTFRSERIAPLEKLTGRFFFGGIILVIVSGMSQLIIRYGLSELTDWQRSNISGIIINVLVYFMLGLILLSQANLARLMMSWRFQKVEIGSDLAKQWAKYGLIFLGLVTAAVFLLPTNYTMGFLTSAAIVILFVVKVLTFLMQLLLMLFSLPLAWLFSLFGAPPEEAEAPPEELPPLPEPALAAAPVPWLEALRSLIFWLVALAIIWYLVKVYLNDRPELLTALKGFKPVNFVLNLLKQFWQQLRRLVTAGVDVIAEIIKLPGHSNRPNVLTGARGWFGMGRLSARERILYYYLNILKRAERRRLARRIFETPFEYEPNLEQAVPDVEPEVAAMTDVFVRARYSQEGFDEEQAASAKQQWQRVRQELRNVGRARGKRSGDEKKT
ncbi:MAG: DUF4129 domain-containing protein [Anaerolineae bacterium]|nr:DUF4129 domain-containing protein [Anaerolineae bacterium]